jgi:hypothetical protein
MLSRDTSQSRCSLALDFEIIVEESIFKRLNADTTPQQYQQAIESLLPLFERLEAEANNNPFHHPAIATTTRHRCVRDSFEAAVFYLKSCAVLAPVPKPAPAPPPPRPKRRSLADMLKPFAAEEGNDSTPDTTD